MTGDSWADFVARIDVPALEGERFGSPSHRVMVAKHSKKLRDMQHPFDPDGWVEALAEAAAWNVRTAARRNAREEANKRYRSGVATRQAARAARKAA